MLPGHWSMPCMLLQYAMLLLRQTSRPSRDCWAQLPTLDGLVFCQRSGGRCVGSTLMSCSSIDEVMQKRHADLRLSAWGTESLYTPELLHGVLSGGWLMALLDGREADHVGGGSALPLCSSSAHTVVSPGSWMAVLLTVFSSAYCVDAVPIVLLLRLRRWWDCRRWCGDRLCVLKAPLDADAVPYGTAQSSYGTVHPISLSVWVEGRAGVGVRALD